MILSRVAAYFLDLISYETILSLEFEQSRLPAEKKIETVFDALFHLGLLREAHAGKYYDCGITSYKSVAPFFVTENLGARI